MRRFEGKTVLVTGASAGIGRHTALEFAREILLLLKAKPEDEISAWYHLNKDGFYAAQ